MSDLIVNVTVKFTLGNVIDQDSLGNCFGEGKPSTIEEVTRSMIEKDVGLFEFIDAETPMEIVSVKEVKANAQEVH